MSNFIKINSKHIRLPKNKKIYTYNILKNKIQAPELKPGQDI